MLHRNPFEQPFSGPVNIDMLTISGKIFTVIYAIIGIPLCLLLMTQCGRMITSIWEGKTLVVSVICFIFVSAIIYDVIEDNSDDVPFFDAVFSVFLQFSTIGQTEKDGTQHICHSFLSLVIVVHGGDLVRAWYRLRVSYRDL
uniref:Aa_trans domain-containing protein n=1 Tax=Angiostrongylus cantonensis TaxID=6313 RepID=A0A0K0DRW6_ANGCA